MSLVFDMLNFRYWWDTEWRNLIGSWQEYDTQEGSKLLNKSMFLNLEVIDPMGVHEITKGNHV